MNIIRVEDLHKSFATPLTRRKVNALNGLSFSIQKGSVVGFLGANGAGKTTTLKIILRLIYADKGQVQLFGKDHRDPALKSRLGFLTERPYFYDHLTGREFLTFCGSLFPRRPEKVFLDEILNDVGLSHAADRPMRQYSKGMLQRIGVAQALVGKPELLILDEPMTGLDPDGRAEMCDIIRRCHRDGTTILFSTHLLNDVETLCNRVVMIDHGKLIAEDSVQNLLSRYSQGWKLSYRDTVELKEIRVSSVEEIQKQIDSLRKQQLTIERVEPLRPSLEDVFLKLKAQSR